MKISMAKINEMIEREKLTKNDENFGALSELMMIKITLKDIGIEIEE